MTTGNELEECGGQSSQDVVGETSHANDTETGNGEVDRKEGRKWGN